ncbi:MAG: 2-dehydropantoate 2-reductase [Desulfurococcaceae archaeon]
MKVYSDVCIVGGGAAGGVLSYYLYRSGFSKLPVYYYSEVSVSAVKAQGGIYVTDENRRVDYLVPVIPRHYETPIDECKFVFNTVKAYSVPQTIELMLNITQPSGVVIMLQNGFGSLELAERSLQGRQVAGGVIHYGAQRVGHGRVLYHGGNTIIAGCRNSLCLDLLEISNALRLGGLYLLVTSNIDFYRWLKLMINAVVNPLTAITRGPNRVVLEKEGLELARAIIEEICEVARGYGYAFNPTEVLDYLKSGIESVASNISSMAQDVINNRPTEIDFLNGFVAKSLGKESSINYILTLIIRLIERGYKLKS